MGLFRRFFISVCRGCLLSFCRWSECRPSWCWRRVPARPCGRGAARSRRWCVSGSGPSGSDSDAAARPRESRQGSFLVERELHSRGDPRLRTGVVADHVSQRMSQRACLTNLHRAAHRLAILLGKRWAVPTLRRTSGTSRVNMRTAPGSVAEHLLSVQSPLRGPRFHDSGLKNDQEFCTAGQSTPGPEVARTWSTRKEVIGGSGGQERNRSN